MTIQNQGAIITITGRASCVLSVLSKGRDGFMKIGKRRVIAYIKLFFEVLAVILIVVLMFKFAMNMTIKTAEDVQQEQSAAVETDQ